MPMSRDVSNLIEYLCSHRWQKSCNYINKFPEMVRNYKSSDNWTCLHFACNLDPPTKVINCLLQAHPEAVLVQDRRGFTPLHLAVYSASHVVVGRLLEQDTRPVHMKAVSNELTPLKFACLKYSEKISGVIDRPVLYRSDLEGITMLFMRKVELLIKAAYYGTIDDRILGIHEPSTACWPQQSLPRRRTLLQHSSTGARENNRKNATRFRMVHACAGIDCPVEMMKFAIKVYPNEVKEADEIGNFPLHIAAASVPSSVTDGREIIGVDQWHQWERTIPEEREQDPLAPTLSAQDKGSDSNDRSTRDLNTKIDVLLQACPVIVKEHNAQSKLPIHVALEAGRDWDNGIHSLLEAHPSILFQNDPEELPSLLDVCQGRAPSLGKSVSSNASASSLSMNDKLDLFPFMYAASSGGSLSAIYQLLRACPELPRFQNLNSTAKPIAINLDSRSIPMQQRKREREETEEQREEVASSTSFDYRRRVIGTRAASLSRVRESPRMLQLREAHDCSCEFVLAAEKSCRSLKIGEDDFRCRTMVTRSMDTKRRRFCHCIITGTSIPYTVVHTKYEL